MKKLELLIPPVALVIFYMVVMLVVSNTTTFGVLPFIQPISYVLVVLGAIVMVAGVINFRQAKTTVNPMKPESATSIVDSGIYNYSRNPMYLGMLLVLLGFGAFLTSVPALVVALTFVVYINQFQIKPEERALEQIFAEQYLDYKKRVRAWL